MDEVTEQHSELEARLVNAQNQEKRILQMLQDRSDKTKDSEGLEHRLRCFAAKSSACNRSAILPIIASLSRTYRSFCGRSTHRLRRPLEPSCEMPPSAACPTLSRASPPCCSSWLAEARSSPFGSRCSIFRLASRGADVLSWPSAGPNLPRTHRKVGGGFVPRIESGLELFGVSRHYR